MVTMAIRCRAANSISVGMRAISPSLSAISQITANRVQARPG